jgi:predicted MFS family arabinose efflux permease
MSHNMFKITESIETRVNVNSTMTIIAIVILGVIASSMFILQPIYVQGLVKYLHFSAEQAGLIASTEVFGIATMAIAANFITQKINWRILSLLFVVTASIGNLLSVFFSSYEALSILRFITGIGCGGLISMSFTMMSLTKRADRNIGYIIAAVLIFGAFGLLTIPSAFQYVGVEGVLAFLALFSVSGLFFIRLLPHSNKSHQEIRSTKIFTLSTKVIALAGVFIYNSAIGIVWVYMFLVGVESGIDEQTVAYALTLSQFIGIAGAMVPIVFEMRFGRLLPLILGIAGSATGIAFILDSPSIYMYTIGVCLFNFLWNMTLPYLLAMLAEYDSSGRIVTIGVGLQMFGNAVGPAIAVLLLEKGGFDFVNSVAIALFALSLILFIPGIQKQSKLKQTEAASLSSH